MPALQRRPITRRDQPEKDQNHHRYGEVKTRLTIGGRVEFAKVPGIIRSLDGATGGANAHPSALRRLSHSRQPPLTHMHVAGGAAPEFRACRLWRAHRGERKEKYLRSE